MKLLIKTRKKFHNKDLLTLQCHKSENGSKIKQKNTTDSVEDLIILGDRSSAVTNSMSVSNEVFSSS